VLDLQESAFNSTENIFSLGHSGVFGPTGTPEDQGSGEAGARQWPGADFRGAVEVVIRQGHRRVDNGRAVSSDDVSGDTRA
jgi:hypothetical protein